MAQARSGRQDQTALLTIGRRIRLTREKLNLSQGQLAGLVGLSQTTLSRYEAGIQDMSATTLVHLSHALRTKVSFLVQGLIIDRTGA